MGSCARGSAVGKHGVSVVVAEYSLPTPFPLIEVFSLSLFSPECSHRRRQYGENSRLRRFPALHGRRDSSTYDRALSRKVGKKTIILAQLPYRVPLLSVTLYIWRLKRIQRIDGLEPPDAGHHFLTIHAFALSSSFRFNLKTLRCRSNSRAQISNTEGTWCFWAPEMCGRVSAGNAAFNAYAADAWAAGITLWCFLYGTVPFFRCAHRTRRNVRALHSCGCELGTTVDHRVSSEFALLFTW